MKSIDQAAADMLEKYGRREALDWANHYRCYYTEGSAGYKYWQSVWELIKKLS